MRDVLLSATLSHYMRLASALSLGLAASCASTAQLESMQQSPPADVQNVAATQAAAPEAQRATSHKLISAALANSLVGDAPVTLSETLLAIDEVERLGDLALRGGDKKTAHGYYALALVKINQWCEAFSAAARNAYIDDFAPEKKDEKVPLSPDAEKMFIEIKLNGIERTGDPLYKQKERLEQKLRQLALGD